MLDRIHVLIAHLFERRPSRCQQIPLQMLLRHVLAAAFYLNQRDGKSGAMMDPEAFCRTMAASYASRRDLKLTATRVARAKNFQKCYQRLIAAAGPYEQGLAQIAQRSAVINYEHRMTGDGVIRIVDQIIAAKDELRFAELQSAIDSFIESQILIPGAFRPIAADQLQGNTSKSRLLRLMQQELEECKQTL